MTKRAQCLIKWIAQSDARPLAWASLIFPAASTISKRGYWRITAGHKGSSPDEGNFTTESVPFDIGVELFDLGVIMHSPAEAEQLHPCEREIKYTIGGLDVGGKTYHGTVYCRYELNIGRAQQLAELGVLDNGENNA